MLGIPDDAGAVGVGVSELVFLSLVSTFGTPVDVTLDELVQETFLPADDATTRILAAR